MPVYVYRNLNTGETFEISQKMTEPALTEHPETGDPVKRLIQPVGIAFKGSGFYATDSRKSSPTANKTDSADDSTVSKTETTSDAKSDTKSDAKSDSKSDSASSSKAETKSTPSTSSQ